MNKEELIKTLKYTEEKHRNDIVNTFDTNISMMCSDVLKVLENCIEIKEEETNGDMIKAMFPDDEIKEIRGTLDSRLLGYRTCLGGRSQDFLLDWWNASYCGKKMDEDESNKEMEVELVTCKNCKHRPVDDRGSIEPPYDVENGRLDETCPCINKADWHYSYVPENEFFCAYAEKKPVTPAHKKSKWIFTKTALDKYGSTVECPSCHKKWETYDEIRFEKETKYCPNCGEKMENEE